MRVKQEEESDCSVCMVCAIYSDKVSWIVADFQKSYIGSSLQVKSMFERSSFDPLYSILRRIAKVGINLSFSSFMLYDNWMKTQVDMRGYQGWIAAERQLAMQVWFYDLK